MSAIATRAFTVSEPAKTLAGENPIILTLNTYFAGSGQNFSEGRFSFVDRMRENFSIWIITNDGYVKKFYAKDFPNKDSYWLSGTLKDQAGTTVTANTLSQIAISFAECLQKDTTLSQNYYISYSATTVFMKAKQSSSRFDLSMGTNIFIKNHLDANTGTGVTYTTLHNGTDVYDGSLVSDYSLYAEVYFSDSIVNQFGVELNPSYFSRVTEVELPFAIDNIHQFDLSSICKSYLDTPLPQFDYPFPIPLENYMRPFYFKYGEKYPLIPNENTKRKREKGKTGYHWVLNASTDLYAANDLSSYTGETLTPQIINVKFLTNSPAVKKSYKEGREFLYATVPSNFPLDLKLYGNIKFWDGTVLNDVLLSEDIDLGSSSNYGGCWSIPVSFSAIGFTSLYDYETGGTKIKQVDISLRMYSGATFYSETKSFRYDYVQPTQRFGVAFKNKLGTYDTYDFINGNIQEDILREVSNYYVPLQFNDNGSVVEGAKLNAIYSNSVTKKLTVNSGYITKTEFDWLLELFTSNEIYNYNDTVNFLKLDSFKYVKNTSSSEYIIECVFLKTLPENNVSI
jgi:hypothetical protein